MSERLLHEERKSVGRAAEMETAFLARVAQLRDELHIRSGKGGTRDRQRIALAVVDAHLRTVAAHTRWHEFREGRQVMDERDLRRVHHAPMLEGQLFEALATRGLVCDPLPEEERGAEQVKDKNWDPVRLCSRPAGWDGTICALVRRVVEVLTKGGDDGERKEPGGVHLGGATDEAPGNHPGGPGALDGPGAAIHPRRPPALLPRGQRGRLARPPGEGTPGRLGPAQVRGQKAPRDPRDDARESQETPEMRGCVRRWLG